jgi:hypothetical protein
MSRVPGYGLRVPGFGFVPIVLVVVLVLVIEKAEYVRKTRWGVEDEYESPVGASIAQSA